MIKMVAIAYESNSSVSKMDTDHWVPISVVADFRKVKAITDDIQEVVNALRRSCKVLVDETGTMAKAITVDRPRTTLILRELPEDATEEEISALFVEAKCPAKLITKEAVGNMWFVEFETAADALAMLNYTRGRYLRGVPIAARLKSNTVLTGGEYKTTQLSMPNSQNTPMLQPVPGWTQSPPSHAQDASMLGMSVPYRRFAAEENFAAEEVWSPTLTQGFVPQDMARRHSVAQIYPPDAYFPPDAQDMNGQMWAPADVFSMSPPEPGLGQHQMEQGYTQPHQFRQEFSGPRRSSDPEFRTQGWRGRGDEFVNRRGDNIRKYYSGSLGARQYRQYDYRGPWEGNERFFNSDRSSDARSDFLFGNPQQPKNRKKGKKNYPRSKGPKTQQQQANQLLNSSGEQNENRPQSDNATSPLNGEPKEQDTDANVDVLDQTNMNNLTGKLSKMTTEGNQRAGHGKRRVTGDKGKQPQVSLKKDNFPPLPSNGAVPAMGETPSTNATLSAPAYQLNSSWAPRPSMSHVVSGTEAPKEESDANEVTENPQKSIISTRPQNVISGMVSSGDPDRQQQQTPQNQSEGLLASSTKTIKPDPQATEMPSEQRAVPVSGMATSASEETLTDLRAAEPTFGKCGNLNPPRPSGGFSYASALKVQQQQQQHETSAEKTESTIANHGQAAIAEV
ncbi:hypothetical protein BGZ54_006718 [Gamsiella multidivaricata]|nr:hypothetical protein BGZ54_006718 [Gamsiella multidivaricata]